MAVTRVRQEIIVVCSFDPDRLRTELTKNEGPKRMRDYLRYARAIDGNKRGDVHNILASLNPELSKTKNGNNRDTLTDRQLENLVYDELIKLGYQVDCYVGNSDYRIDLAVIDPDDSRKYILAIETDGRSFHSAKSAIERDVNRQEFLETKGWVVERIWSRNWWRDPNKEINRIHQKIQDLRRKHTSSSSSSSSLTSYYI